MVQPETTGRQIAFKLLRTSVVFRSNSAHFVWPKAFFFISACPCCRLPVVSLKWVRRGAEKVDWARHVDLRKEALSHCFLFMVISLMRLKQCSYLWNCAPSYLDQEFTTAQIPALNKECVISNQQIQIYTNIGTPTRSLTDTNTRTRIGT